VALQAGDWTRAETAFRRALASNPFFLPAWNGLGIALRGSGREAEARVAFERALALNPHYAPAKRNLEDPGAISGAPPSR
jgi:Flp pilus assembly protein TadD